MQKKSLKCVDLSYNIAKIGGSHYKYAARLFSKPEARPCSRGGFRGHCQYRDCLATLADWLRSGGGANNLETLVLCGDGTCRMVHSLFGHSCRQVRGFFAYDALDWMCNAGKSYGLGPNFSESLLALGENKSITELDISGNKIGDAVLLPTSHSRDLLPSPLTSPLRWLCPLAASTGPDEGVRQSARQHGAYLDRLRQ